MAASRPLTIVVRALAVSEITPANALRVLGKELAVGGLNGLLLLIAGVLVALVWFGNVLLGVLFGVALLVTLIFAALAGVAIPLALRSPRRRSGPGFGRVHDHGDRRRRLLVVSRPRHAAFCSEVCAMAQFTCPSLNFDLGETAEMIRATVAAFAQAEIAPRAEEIDRSNEFPRDLWPRLGALGAARDHRRGGVWRGGARLHRACRRDGGDLARKRFGRPELRCALEPLRQPDPAARHRGAKAPATCRS